MTDWAIPQQAKLKYTQLFNLHDRSRSGFLSGLQCRDILLQSGLPRNVLAEIWNLSDIDGDGQLTREEFILAMHLTNQVRTGQTLPSELPADLVPPSYRRTRSISTASVHSASSSVSGGTVAAGSATIVQDDQLSQKSSDTATSTGSVLNSHSFEDKRRENFEKGRAELERRRLKMIEQQTSILNEQLSASKKQVAEAKAKIDKMRSDRDTKAGLITSLEAQLQTIRDRKAYLDHEEQTLIAIAKDLNIVKSANATEIDLEATKVKQENIRQMKERLVELQKERDSKAAELNQSTTKLEEKRQELSSVSQEADKLYEQYKAKVSQAKVLRQKLIEENKSKTSIDLDSVWDSAPSFSPKTITQQSNNSRVEQPGTTPFESSTDDPWSATTPASADNFTRSSDDAFGFGPTPTAINNNNNNSSSARDYSALADLTSKTNALSISHKNDGFDGDLETKAAPSATSTTTSKRKYRALYAFEARNPDELTINPGDIIVGSEVVCEPGWLSGEANGQCGLFPEAYVEPLPADLADNLNFTMTAGTAKSNPIQATPAATATAAASSSPIGAKLRYKVIYEFEARNPDELTIRSGDIINGVDGAHEPGWLMGELNGQKGLFPEAYVEKVAEVQAEQTTEQPTGTLRRGSSSGSLRSKKSKAKKAEVATVIASYRALGQEQLNLEKGQLVMIRRKMDSGWWEGELCIKEAEKSIGQSEERGRNELDHLIAELINSEWDYVNDLRLCQSAYIFPLSSSFDVSHIFKNWNQLIQLHETHLNKLSENCLGKSRATIDYALVFETFQQLFNSIVDSYVEFCSYQSESVRQLETKIVSDIRFRQLINESQRKLQKILEQQAQQNNQQSSENAPVQSDIDAAQHSRALRNSNLPLTSFLIKPMQRMTKYSLIFDRILAIVGKQGPRQFQAQVERLRNSSRMLCGQVNEACRIKEDDQENKRKLRWCQNHVKQSATTDQVGLSTTDLQRENSIRLINRRLSESFSSYSSDSVSNSSLNNSLRRLPLDELIEFDSETNCLGPRKFVKGGSMIKIRATCRDLVVFLFNDLLLMTQVKGGATLRVEDIFKSERAQQAYYKIYKSPILLEHIILNDFTTQQAALPINLTCTSAGGNFITDEQEALIISLHDQSTADSYNLMALNADEKADWIKELSQLSQAAKEARSLSNATGDYCNPVRKFSVDECLGRLFVTVLELNRVSSTKQPESSPQTQTSSPRLASNCSPDRRRYSQTNTAKTVCIRLQLRRYRKRTNSSGRVVGEVLPLSDAFKTKAVHLGNLMAADLNQKYSQQDPTGNAEGPESSIKSTNNPTSLRFDDDSNQFLLTNKLIDCDGQDYLDIELVEDFRFRPSRMLARKRLNIDLLLGRESASDEHTTTLDSFTSRASSRQSIRTSKPLPVLQPNRPTELELKLKPTTSDGLGSASTTRHSTPNGSQLARNVIRDQSLGFGSGRLSVRLKLHLQLFCDNSV